MSATGLEVFDSTLQLTNIWLDDLMVEMGPDRKLAWAVLGAVLRAIRDRLPAGEAAHLGAQLPLLIRGAYYDQYQPEQQPTKIRRAEQFLERVAEGMRGHRPIDLSAGATAVFDILNRRLPEGTCRKVRAALPEDIGRLWPAADGRAPDMTDEGAPLRP